MNFVFASQSDSLPLFWSLAKQLSTRVEVGRTAFTIADSWAYRSWLEKCPEFEDEDSYLLKEWHLTDRAARKSEINHELLAQYEAELGGPGLFGSIVADRRLIFGPNCTFTQDYRRRFTDDELLGILQTALVAVDDMFNEVKPDAVFSFICVTILDYLVYLFAKSRGIRFLNLRTTRISNHIHFSSTLNDPSPELSRALGRVKRSSSRKIGDAKYYIASVRAHHAKYEGVVMPSAKPAQRLNFRGKSVGSLWRFLQTYRKYRSSESAQDNHCPGLIRPLIYKFLLNPMRAARADRLLRPKYLGDGNLGNRRLIFYPLHTEPEVSLLVYGRPFINQIEVVRSIALSLPAGMLLVLKEHPWMVGKRSVKSYRKLLNIPNVAFAAPESDARFWIEKADLTVVLTSSVALEAVILKCPVVTIGHVPMNLLPSGMVRKCHDLSRLAQVLRESINDHNHDEKALEEYVAAVMEFSVKVNLYTNLLGRSVGFNAGDTLFEDDIRKLASYAISRLDDYSVNDDDGTLIEAAEW